MTENNNSVLISRRDALRGLVIIGEYALSGGKGGSRFTKDLFGQLFLNHSLLATTRMAGIYQGNVIRRGALITTISRVLFRLSKPRT